MIGTADSLQAGEAFERVRPLHRRLFDQLFVASSGRRRSSCCRWTSDDKRNSRSSSRPKESERRPRTEGPAADRWFLGKHFHRPDKSRSLPGAPRSRGSNECGRRQAAPRWPRGSQREWLQKEWPRCCHISGNPSPARWGVHGRLNVRIPSNQAPLRPATYARYWPREAETTGGLRRKLSLARRIPRWAGHQSPSVLFYETPRTHYREGIPHSLVTR